MTQIQRQVVLNSKEFCIVTNLSESTLIKIVESGVVEPSGKKIDEWYFEEAFIDTVIRAKRLKQDLDLDWHGIAFALDLLAEINVLKLENMHLRRRINRFISE